MSAAAQQQQTKTSKSKTSKSVVTTTTTSDQEQDQEHQFLDQQQQVHQQLNDTVVASVDSSSQDQQAHYQNDNNNDNQEDQSFASMMLIDKQQQQQQQALSVQQEQITIDRLTEQGVAAADITKLKSAGIFTVPGIHMQCRKDLCNIKGLSDTKIEKILEAAKKLADAGFVSATKCLERRSHIPKITTGSKDLDALLGGGIEACSITEAFGEFRTGKSQIAHTLCVACQLPTSSGGGNGKAVFVDTEGTFRPERITPIAERFGLNPADVLDNILVARAYTHEHQANLISAVAAKMSQEKYSLLVVDSITALFRTDFSGRGELAERQQKLGKMMNQLMKIAEEFTVAVYITNQVVADPGANMTFVADPKKPVGGHILAHASTTRLSLRKGRGENRICKIFDSPSLPESECQFSISERGIDDAVAA